MGVTDGVPAGMVAYRSRPARFPIRHPSARAERGSVQFDGN